MAYTKLNLKDYVDKWDAAKVEHLENGIIDAQALYSRYMNMTYAEKANLRSNINNAYQNLTDSDKYTIQNITKNIFNNIYDSDKQSWRNLFDVATTEGVNQFTFTTIGLLLDDMLKKCMPPSYSWDGDTKNKELFLVSDNAWIELPMLDEAYISCRAYLAKVSDNADYRFKNGIATFSGGIVLIYLLAMMEYMDFNYDNTYFFMEIMQGILSMYICKADPTGCFLYSELFGDSFPLLAVLPEDTQYDGINISKGVYALIMYDNTSSQPLLWAGNYWNNSSSNITLTNNNLYWEDLKFNIDNDALSITNNTIEWSGPNNLPFFEIFHLVSHRASDFKKCLENNSESIITVKLSNGEEHTGKIKDILRVQNNMFALGELVMVAPEWIYNYDEDGEIVNAIPPGVYFVNMDGLYVSKITFDDEYALSDLINYHKLPHKLYDCPAYEENINIPGQQIEISNKIGDISIEFPNAPENSVADILTYKKISDKPLENFNELKYIFIADKDMMNIQYNIENNEEYGFVYNNGYYCSTNNNIDDSVALCRVNIISDGNAHLMIEWEQYGVECNYDYGIFSKLNTTLSYYPEDDAEDKVFISLKGAEDSGIIDYGIIPTGEHFIEIKYQKDTSVSNGTDQLRFKILSEVENTINIMDSDEWLFTSSQINLTEQAWAVAATKLDDDAYYYLIINVLEDSVFNDVYLTKGLYSLTTDPENVYNIYVQKFVTKTQTTSIIHKMHEKFLPDTVALKTETIITPQSAQVGQILSVKEIDENGKPINWEVINLPKATAVADATDLTVTALEFNALLESLREAGLLEFNN